MANDEVRLDPTRAMAGARDMVAAAKEMRGQRTSIGGEITAASADRPWGKDDIGAAFEKTYRGFEEQMLKSWESIAGYVGGLGYAVAQSVQASVQADGEAGTRVRKTWKNT
jgi:hypothetical protein